MIDDNDDPYDDPLYLPEEDEQYEDDSNDTNSEDLNRNNEFIGPILPGGHRFDKKLVCIKYPANVVNDEKAIETLGGITEISETVGIKNRRMELRFRPDDGYCKPACGDRQQTNGFLLRIRIKKSRRHKVEEDEERTEKQNSTSDASHSHSNKSTKSKNLSINKLTNDIANCSVESNNAEQNKNENDDNIPPTFDRNKYENLASDVEYELPKLKVLGKVDTEFRFTSLCDFQYLPITKNKENPTVDECIYEKIYPVGLPPYSWMTDDVPLFLPPAAFSRMDSIQQYSLKSDVIGNEENLVIGKTRKRRAGFSNFINFNAPDVPRNPPKGIETALRVKFLQSSHVEKMKKYFDERPIWSKTALMYVSGFSNEHMKVLLPAVAYYFMTGPWRITWVKLGYDPRKDPEARKYQTLDYRLKAMHGLHSSVLCKRNYSEYTLPYKSTPNSKPKIQVLSTNASLSGESNKKTKTVEDNVYIYRPGTIPASRQMFYQYCDLHVKEIKDMLEKYVPPSVGSPCHEKYGWFPSRFDDMCREIINKHVRLELRKMMNIPENHPTSLPRKRKTGPTGRIRKKAIKKPKKKQTVVSNVEHQPSAMMLIDENDIRSEEEDEGEWEDANEDAEAGPSSLEPNETDATQS
ncbi:general transcription factor 3C polypeptide 5 [Trichogramma pretiosum]|uniref:general transcription factor 3C polypeptide 5 n=1 Tax=Trichogramma pretiosum TaxID=7493 RepID=UPI0006C96B7B|nr:general transcription factor 3C polypeptide 5 [Trichogramma pretiosum]